LKGINRFEIFGIEEIPEYREFGFEGFSVLINGLAIYVRNR